jgi:hypothetical protein
LFSVETPTPKSDKSCGCVKPLVVAIRTASRRNSSVYFVAIPFLLHSKHCSKETGTKPRQDQTAAAGFTAAIRLHPKERKDEPLAQALRDVGFEMDSADMTTALSRAAVVASSNSTVLCEAAAFGIPAVQIEDLAVFEFEGAEMCPVARFDPARSAAIETGEPAFRYLDVDRFFADVTAMMT